ncbi:MAG: PEP-utilizing enzyme [Acidimicrobiales bacterium]|nr:PEP-utilizing enzyme [Acidimicrobiales bacterium]
MAASWEAPGPGSWQLDRSHWDCAMTPIGFQVGRCGLETAYRTGFAESGVPADGIDVRNVNGFAYSRIRPLLGADKPSTKAPPDWVIKLAGRVHPEMRRREKRAANRLANPQFRQVLANWTTTIRPATEARNRAFQAIDLSSLTDEELGAHTDKLFTYACESSVLHHRLHMDDLGPLGHYVVFCRDHGIEAEAALQALAGASPSTTEPRRALVAIRAEVESAGTTPRDLNDVRAASPRAAALLDTYLDRHGSVLFSGYDLDSATLGERPDVAFAAIMTATDPTPGTNAATAAAQLLATIDPADGEEFSRMLTDAREAMDMRDDNGPMTIEWPGGLMRLALVEVGWRLADQGSATHGSHVFELDAEEITPLLIAGRGPDADELAERAAARAAQRVLDPPPFLGDDPEQPPLHLLPPAMAQAMDMVTTVMATLFGEKDESAPPLTGSGIGTKPYIGVARVAETAEDAIAAMQPGDVLITRATSPAFNLVLGIAGGLVTVHGGPMSHAAVLSRELGLPAVVGVEDCLEHIRTGDRVEIDPAKGIITVLA